MTRGVNLDAVPVIDRTGWGPGPWDGEPDRIEWRHRGVPCLMVRNWAGNWCGYAAVPPGHPWHGADYGGCTHAPRCADGNCYCGHTPDAGVEVHGGLTYADRCAGAICHAPQPGESDDVWWFGFDCGHGQDVMPGMEAYYRKAGRDLLRLGDVLRPTYKDAAYVRGEVERLADQLLAVR